MKVRNDFKTYNIGIIIASLVLWFVGLSYGSGFGQSYHIYEKTMVLTLILTGITFLLRQTLRFLDTEVFIIVCVLLLCNLYTFFHYGHTYFEYLWLYLIVFLYSQQIITAKDLRWIGLAYGILGLVILMIANYTDILSGWDGNSISMVAFFSYTAFAAGVLRRLRCWNLVLFLTYSYYYFSLLYVLDSRSSILFSIILLLSILNIIPLKKTFQKQRLFLLLITPLLIALFIILIKDLPVIAHLNEWSYTVFQKPIFNGRDDLWLDGLRSLADAPLFGSGDLGGNWHNSAITLLAGTGIIGYTSALVFIRKYWLQACHFLDDGSIYNLLLAFVAIWLQQSVELGLVQTRGNPIIFVILGLLMARIHTVKNNKDYAE